MFSESPMVQKILKILEDSGPEEELVGFYVRWFYACENSYWLLLKKIYVRSAILSNRIPRIEPEHTEELRAIYEL